VLANRLPHCPGRFEQTRIAEWPLRDSREPAGESNFCGLR
jgi:hypothetical protein